MVWYEISLISNIPNQPCDSQPTLVVSPTILVIILIMNTFTFFLSFFSLFHIVGAFLAPGQGCPCSLLAFFAVPHRRILPPPLMVFLSLQLTLIRQRGEEEFFDVGQQKKPKGYKGHPWPGAKNAPTHSMGLKSKFFFSP